MSPKPYRRLVLFLCFTALALSLMTTPCLAKDTLIQAVGGENAEGYDPTRGWGAYGNPLFQSTLLRRDADLNIVGDLATSWKLSEDRLTWAVVLRGDVNSPTASP